MFLFSKLADLKQEVVLQFSELFAIVSVKFALKNFRKLKANMQVLKTGVFIIIIANLQY